MNSESCRKVKPAPSPEASLLSSLLMSSSGHVLSFLRVLSLSVRQFFGRGVQKGEEMHLV